MSSTYVAYSGTAGRHGHFPWPSSAPPVMAALLALSGVIAYGHLLRQLHLSNCLRHVRTAAEILAVVTVAVVFASAIPGCPEIADRLIAMLSVFTICSGLILLVLSQLGKFAEPDRAA